MQCHCRNDIMVVIGGWIERLRDVGYQIMSFVSTHGTAPSAEISPNRPHKPNSIPILRSIVAFEVDLDGLLVGLTLGVVLGLVSLVTKSVLGGRGTVNC